MDLAVWRIWDLAGGGEDCLEDGGRDGGWMEAGMEDGRGIDMCDGIGVGGVREGNHLRRGGGGVEDLGWRGGIGWRGGESWAVGWGKGEGVGEEMSLYGFAVARVLIGCGVWLEGAGEEIVEELDVFFSWES